MTEELEPLPTLAKKKQRAITMVEKELGSVRVKTNPAKLTSQIKKFLVTTLEPCSRFD